MNLYDIVNNYNVKANATLKKLMDEHKVAAQHILSKSIIDGCEHLGDKGTHMYRTVETLKQVGFGKLIEESKLFDNGMVLYMTTTGNRVVFDAEGKLVTFLPQTAAHIRRKFPAFANTLRGKQLCKLVTSYSFNIWDFGAIK